MDIQNLRADYIFEHVGKNFSLTGSAIPFSRLFVYILPLISVFLIIVLGILFRKIIVLILNIKEKPVFLELTPPALTDKTAYTTKQLFSVLHKIGVQRTILERILGKREIFSFEITSTREEGIRYIVKTSENQVNTIKQTI